MAGAHRNWQNIERIIGGLSYYLQNGDLWPEAQSSSASTSKRQGIAAGIILASILLIIMIVFTVAANIE
jgi:hypothetical protein